jgi:hypothetical protein
MFLTVGLIAIAAWSLLIVLALVLCSMASRSDSAAAFEDRGILPLSDY